MAERSSLKTSVAGSSPALLTKFLYIHHEFSYTLYMDQIAREKYNAYQRTYQRQRWLQRRKELIALLGGKCVQCGATENLEFDHIDPATKSFSIGSRTTASKERMMAEIKKCQLLCHACHEKKTYSTTKLGRKMTPEERKKSNAELTKKWLQRKRLLDSKK